MLNWKVNQIRKRVPISFNGAISEIRITYSICSKLKRYLALIITSTETGNLFVAMVIDGFVCDTMNKFDYEIGESSNSASCTEKSFSAAFSLCTDTKGYLVKWIKNGVKMGIYGMPQKPVVFNQNPSENSSQSPPQIDHQCCYVCGNSLDGIFCQRCTCKSCRKRAHYGYNCPSKVLIISNSEPCHDPNVEEFPQTLPSSHPTCYSGDKNSFAYDSTSNLVKDSPNVFNPPSQPPMYSYEFYGDDAHYSYDCPPQVPFIYDSEPINDSMIELCGTFQAWLQQRKDQVCQRIPLCYDDEESSILLRDIIISELPLCIAITPVVSTKDSLIMGDEHLDTISEKESDEFIKSSVENLVPNPSESEDECECDVLDCDDSQTTNFSTFSNPLFDDSTSSDDESSHEEFDSLLEEFFGELAHTDLIPSRINEANCDPEEDIHLIERLLYANSSPRPPEYFNSENSDAMIESFSLSPIPVEDSDPFVEEIDLFLVSDGSIPSSINSDYSDFEGDNLFLERLLHDNPIPLSGILDFSNVIRVSLPFFTYPVTSSILLYSESEDTIFNPDISNYHFSSLDLGVSHQSGTFMKFNVYPNHLNEIPIDILSSTCFPIDQ
nr:hypothetical protein [Tanacetum cinerariifolium]